MSKFEVIGFGEPRSWRLTSHDDASMEGLFCIQGVLCTFDLPVILAARCVSNPTNIDASSTLNAHISDRRPWKKRGYTQDRQ